jgi:flavin-binding monooxygenase-like protein
VPETVAVVGAGGSGLLAAAALRRAGVAFEVLEGRDGVGGTWRYDERGEGSACYASLVANTSKLRMSLRAARIPGRPWHYAEHTEMLAYLEGLADREELRPHIRLGWPVREARPDDGGWVLSNSSGEERRYRSVVCALGVNGRPRYADLPGDFAGEQLHSSAYRTPDRFADRDVLVIGLGTSGSEVAGEIARTARSVRVSVRSPLWMMTRRLAGFPIDWFDNSAAARLLPWSVRRRVLQMLCTATTGRLHRRGVPRPTRRCGDDIIAISDTFPRAVRAGLLEFLPAVSRADGRRVSFVDGTAAEVDAIVHATGFDPPTDFLPEHARPTGRGLYRGIAHPEVANLYFVGLFEAHRALLPIAEHQAAWTADVLAGRVALPPPETRRRAAAHAAERRLKDFGDRHPFFLDHGRYRAALRRDRRSHNGR